MSLVAFADCSELNQIPELKDYRLCGGPTAFEREKIRKLLSTLYKEKERCLPTEILVPKPTHVWWWDEFCGEKPPPNHKTFCEGVLEVKTPYDLHALLRSKTSREAKLYDKLRNAYTKAKRAEMAQQSFDYYVSDLIRRGFDSLLSPQERENLNKLSQRIADEGDIALYRWWEKSENRMLRNKLLYASSPLYLPLPSRTHKYNEILTEVNALFDPKTGFPKSREITGSRGSR